MNGIMDPGAVLKDREDACNLVRIPTGRYPLFSTTKYGTFNAAGVAEFVIEAESDLLIAELTVDGAFRAGSLILVDAEYCNTKYLEHSSRRNWSPCCDRKPFFLVGVRENKKITFRLTGGTDGDAVNITIAGFQGSGCCG